MIESVGVTDMMSMPGKTTKLLLISEEVCHSDCTSKYFGLISHIKVVKQPQTLLLMKRVLMMAS